MFLIRSNYSPGSSPNAITVGGTVENDGLYISLHWTKLREVCELVCSSKSVTAAGIITMATSN